MCVCLCVCPPSMWGENFVSCIKGRIACNFLFSLCAVCQCCMHFCRFIPFTSQYVHPLCGVSEKFASCMKGRIVQAFFRVHRSMYCECVCWCLYCMQFSILPVCTPCPSMRSGWGVCVCVCLCLLCVCVFGFGEGRGDVTLWRVYVGS